VFKVSARTVLELGSELISSDIIAFYELIKNGFDAGTKSGVEVHFDIVLSRKQYLNHARLLANGASLSSLRPRILEDLSRNASEAAQVGFRETIMAVSSIADLKTHLDRAQAQFNTIRITDTGSGMSLDDLRRNFLVIGTSSRKKAVEAALAKGEEKSPFLGEKGLGRLSAMRLGERLRVETARANDAKLNILDIDWRAFADLDALLEQISVEPTSEARKPTADWHGTTIIIGDLTENWTRERVNEMAELDFVKLTDPFQDVATRPKIVIKWNGDEHDRIAIPFMRKNILEAAHAKVTARYDIVDGKPQLKSTVEALDLGFDHPKEKQSILLTVDDLQGTVLGRDGQIDDDALESVGPFSFEAYWYNRRRLGKIDSIGDQRAVRKLLDQWVGILLFRDRFRVFPYGEEKDDWLELDRRALRRSSYTMNKTQFIGRVNISRTLNPRLVDQTNREGLRSNPEQKVLLEIIRYAVQDQLGGHMADIEKRYKAQKIDLGDAQEKVTTLEKRARGAISKLRKLAPPEGTDAVDELQQTLFEFAEFAAKARERIEQVEQEHHQMVEMAGVGLMVEVVAHELARASENALMALESLKGRDVPQQLQAHFNTLKSEMKSISKRVRVLDPLSVAGRQRAEIFLLDDLVRETFEAHEAQLIRRRIKPILKFRSQSIKIRAVKGMIVQVLENLISNSVYWLEVKSEREPSFAPEIRVEVHGGPPTILFEDNGPGIAQENKDQIFKIFFSLKDTKHRRGLGLFIARDAAQHHGGTLVVDDQETSRNGRLNRFIFELPAGVQQ
jgi:signal transduction histidine kinase